MTRENKSKGELLRELESLEQSLEEKEAVLDSTMDGILTADTDGRIRYVNSSFLDLWGYESEQEVLDREITDLWQESEQVEGIQEQVLTQGEWKGILSAETEPGEEMDVEIYAQVIKDKQGNPTRMTASFRDISQVRRDPLTGLYNRHYFNEQIEKEVSRGHRYGHELGVLMIDVNKFKKINDQYSHQIGDQVLQKMGDLLKQETREGDSVIRYGGDEYLVLMPETDGEVSEVKERIEHQVEKWNQEQELVDMPITLAIGGTYWSPADEAGIEQIIDEADRKMYAEKERIHKEVYHDSDNGYEVPEGRPADNENF